jgi:hypothetical protein
MHVTVIVIIKFGIIMLLTTKQAGVLSTADIVK